jgi:NitT/TauT family transport system substrate-binding protein
MAVLRILDTLPMYVAAQEGLFEKHGVRVEFIPVGSAPERDSILNTGQADGMINEIVSTLFYNKDEPVVQIVRFARVATAEHPMFHVLASQASGITTVEGLEGAKVGISQGTVIEYITDRLLEAEGLEPGAVEAVAVPGIPDRMTLLSSGELQAAVLPDPFSFLAMQSGAVVVVDDSSHPEFGHSTITFRTEVIEAQPEAVRAFLAAIEEATALINADPGKWTGLLVERELVPAPLQGTYEIGPYPTAGVPSAEQWNDVLAWARDKGLIDKDVSYETSVNAGFLP